MNAPISSAAVAATALACSMLAGCGGISQMTRQHVVGAESAVTQADQTLGKSEAGAVELQRAKENIAQAKRAIDKKDEKQAVRYADQAKLDAELAVAKSQDAEARKAAADLLASIEALRQEAQRSTDNAAR